MVNGKLMLSVLLLKIVVVVTWVIEEMCLLGSVNSTDTLIRERLDRYIEDNHWCAMFSFAQVIHFPICNSDHAAILLKFGTTPDRRENGRLFRFEALWLSSEECGQVVSNAWLAGAGAPLHERIEQVAGTLSKWAADTFGNTKKKVKDAERRLARIQGGQLDARRLQQCHDISEELNDLRRLEESYWHARAGKRIAGWR